VTPIRFLAERQPCRACGEPCYTLRPGKRTRVPEHPLCARVSLDELSEPDTGREALQLLAETFGVLTVLPPPPVKRSELGPCVRCRQTTRRYGPFGQTWCDRCREKESKE